MRENFLKSIYILFAMLCGIFISFTLTAKEMPRTAIYIALISSLAACLVLIAYVSAQITKAKKQQQHLEKKVLKVIDQLSLQQKLTASFSHLLQYLLGKIDKETKHTAEFTRHIEVCSNWARYARMHAEKHAIPTVNPTDVLARMDIKNTSIDPGAPSTDGSTGEYRANESITLDELQMLMLKIGESQKDTTEN